MIRYVAFLRGVSPMNAKMQELRKCFESAGFKEVITVLSSGNVVFISKLSTEFEVEQKAESAMIKQLGRAFFTIVRPVSGLQKMLESDPYSRFRLTPEAKRVVTFLRNAHPSSLKLPIELDGARILAIQNREAFTAYVSSPRGPVFMTLIEKTFGTEVTTRTWDTVQKCIRAQAH